jgi:hypothetical protein
MCRTIFHEDTSVWPMRDNADPLDGWSAEDVEMTPYGPAKADIYGKLFVHLRSVLRAFLNRITNLKVSFRLLQVDARLLPNHLEDGTFDRIEVRSCTFYSSKTSHLTSRRPPTLPTLIIWV